MAMETCISCFVRKLCVARLSSYFKLTRRVEG